MKFEVGDLITLAGLSALIEEEKYKASRNPFPGATEFIGIITEVDVPLDYYEFQEIGYRIHWLGDTGIANNSIFFEEELELIERGKG